MERLFQTRPLPRKLIARIGTMRSIKLALMLLRLLKAKFLLMAGSQLVLFFLQVMVDILFLLRNAGVVSAHTLSRNMTSGTHPQVQAAQVMALE